MNSYDLMQIENKYSKIAGVYIIKVNDEVIYVGETSDLFRRILTHYTFTVNNFIDNRDKERYDRWHQYNELFDFKIEIYCTFPESVDRKSRQEIEKSLIKKYDPPFNKRHTTHKNDYDYSQICFLEDCWHDQL